MSLVNFSKKCKFSKKIKDMVYKMYQNVLNTVNTISHKFKVTH